MATEMSRYETMEDNFQNKFESIQLPFTPKTVVSVELLGFRKVSVGRIRDFFDTPDPQFRVMCPQIPQLHLREFKTQNIPENVTEGFVGETYKFVVPKDHPPDAAFNIEIELSDVDLVSNDVIGQQVVDVSKLPADGSVHTKTLIFGKNNGELDIKISKVLRTTPDFRYSMQLSPEERAFRKKRLPLVFAAMKNILKDKGPKRIIETPVVSLVGSGGGYRAVIGMCGAMEAFRDAGLLDIFTYSCGLSGSSWYLASAYLMNGAKASEQREFHENLRERFSHNLFLDMIKPTTIRAYRKYLKATKKKTGQPHTFANYFPGYLVGRQMMGEKMALGLEDMIPYVEDAQVPFPILVALHVKNTMKASKYHAYVERTPYEISLPSYGVNIKPTDEGSEWNAGYLVRRHPQFPIHFTIAMTGCAFCVLLHSFLETRREADTDLVEYIEKERLEGLQKTYRDSDEESAESESEDDDDESEDIESNDGEGE